MSGFSPVQAQTAALDSSPDTLSRDLKLSTQQRKTIESISDIAFDQMDTLLSSGFDPRKIDRSQLEHRSDSLQKLFTSLRLDDQQTNSLRSILRKARDQMKRGMEEK